MIKIIYLVCEMWFLNFALLKSTALLSNEKLKMLFVSTSLSTMLSIISTLFVHTRAGRVMFTLGTTIWYICLTFKFCTFKKFAKLYLLYILMMLCYGGVCYFLSSFMLIQSHVILVLANVLVFVVIYLLSRWLQKKKRVETFCHDIQIKHGAKIVVCKAFLDSGNLLVDPMTDKPVNLLNYKIFNQLFEDSVKIEDLLRGAGHKCAVKAHYISFNTLNYSDKILVFQLDEVKIDGKTEKDAMFGLTFKNFNQAFGSDVILNSAFA